MTHPRFFRIVVANICVYTEPWSRALITESIHDQSVVLHLESTEKSSAIRELIRRAKIFDGLDDAEAIGHSVIRREDVMSTGFGRGVAIAHGESACIDRALVALGLSEGGVEFESADGKPVHILFLVVNPAGEQSGYLDILSRLSGILRIPENRNRLRGCSCIGDVASTVREALDAIA